MGRCSYQDIHSDGINNETSFHFCCAVCCATGSCKNRDITKSTGARDKFILSGILLYQVTWKLVEATVGILN